MSYRRLLLESVLLLCPWSWNILLPRHVGVTLVKAVNQTELYSLMDKLFSNYKPEVRPTTSGEATFIFTNLHLLSIQGLDEKSQELESAVVLDAFWVDDWLSWDPDLYGNVSEFLYPQSKVWLPDLVVENSVESQRQLGYNMNLVRIDYEGWVHWKPSQVIKTGCNIDVTYYPFDIQTCDIIVSTWMSTKDEIDIDPYSANQGLDLTRYSRSGTWELLSDALEILPNENDVTRIQFTLKLKRLKKYYVLNIILPVLFLSSTASLVFFLPADAGEKIGMGITVLLAYAVYLTIIADNMPQTSLQVSYLAVYLTLLLGLTALGVVLAVVVLHIHHKPDDCNIGKRTERITRKFRVWFFLYKEERVEDTWATNIAPIGTSEKDATTPRPQSKGTVTPQPPEAASPPPSYRQMEEEITWPKVAETVDRVMFIFTSCLVTILTAVFIPLLALGS